MRKRILTFLLIISVLFNYIFIFSSRLDTVSGYGEVSMETGISFTETMSQPGYQEWLTKWQAQSAAATGHIILTPGEEESCLNFSWYSDSIGKPAVQLGTEPSFSNSKIFDGQAVSIDRSNGVTTYCAANHVTVKHYLKPDTTYYYRYTSDFDATEVVWSKPFSYNNSGTDSISAILVGDPQIGASGNIASDTCNWNQTLQQAVQTAPDASLLLSAGDQINYKTDNDVEGVRESEYAGFLYPKQLRGLPVAAAIGNHETRGSDYRYHFNNPNNTDNYGSTPSGCDYYFSRGNALFIVLNSNSRKMGAHRKLMKKAVAAHPDARWRIALMHHDIYGSGTMHSNRTSANLRTVFAPLMDEYRIDAVFSGHDHSYACSYSMLDGTAIRYPGNTHTNPAGTIYFSLGTSSGSKIYGLASPKQYYVAERSNYPLPTFSVLSIKGNTLSVKTYDNNENPYADDVTIKKTKTKTNPLAAVKKAENRKKKNFTKTSYNQLKSALTAFDTLFCMTKRDKGAEKIKKYFRTSKDPLSYYGYAAGTTEALPDGFSTLLDKSRRQCISITSSDFKRVYNRVISAGKKLVKTTLNVKKGKKSLKSGAVLTLKEGKKIRLNISAAPSRYKVSCTSGAGKYVSINKKGVIRAKKRPGNGTKFKKNTVPVTIRFQNRVIKLKVKVR